MKVKAHSKINLTLNILGKRPDGYHNVDMIMQTLEFGDTVFVEKTFGGITLSGTGALKYDETNLAYKAAKLFFDVSGVRGGAKIHIEKNIPVCAGMAGGSTDAAAVLRCLNLLYGKPFSKKRLAKISKRLGADVPYCIWGGTARAEGIGEVITPLNSMGKVTVVVVKPPVAISTPQAYAGLNHSEMLHPDTERAVKALGDNNRKKFYALMGNSFETSVFKEYPQIKDIKEALVSMGANTALMSGSGSTVFGLFEDDKKAKEAYNSFNDKFEDVFLTHTTDV